MTTRQTLSFVRLCRLIDDVGVEMLKNPGISPEYSQALVGYAAATLVRKLKFSTRGAKMRNTPGAGLVDHIFANESTIAFSYDFFEVGLGDGPGTWDAMAKGTVRTVDDLLAGPKGVSASVHRGSAEAVMFRNRSMATVVTDPPYDSMVYYT